MGGKTNKKRNWPLYNRQLIKRGEFYINPRFLNTWNEEIKEMNLNKEGKPFFYPSSLIEFLAMLHSKGFDYRALEGVLHALSPKFNSFPVISYSQISRRTNEMKISFKDYGDNLVVGVDGSGMKVSNRGDWMRHKWKVRKGWVKVVILGDKEGNIVDVCVGNEGIDERAKGRSMVKKKAKKIKKLLGDGLHDNKETFNLCKKLGIEPVIKIRKNAIPKSDGSFLRKKCVIEYKKLGHKKWVKEKGYGIRWVCTEGIFSAVKRIFGEYVRALTKRNIYHEAKLKFWAYSQLKAADH